VPADRVTVDPEHAARTTTGRTVASNAIWNLAGTFLPQGYLFALSIAAARFLGPDQFGRQSFIAFAELTVVSLLGSSLSYALARSGGAALGAGRRGEVIVLARVSSRLSRLTAMLAGLILVAFGLLGSEPRWAWILAGVWAATSVLTLERNSVLVGLQRWRETKVIAVVVGAVVTAVVIAVLAAGGGITGIFAVEAAGGFVLLATTSLLARRALRQMGEEPQSAPVRQMLRYALVSTFGVVLTLVVWKRSEFFFLDRYSTNHEIAFYSIGFAAVAALLVIPMSFSGVLLPSFATLHGAGASDRIRAGHARATRLLVLLALPLTAGAMALGPRLVDLLYGSSYHRAGIVLVLLMIPVPLAVLGNLSTVLLAALDRLPVSVVIGSVGAVANIALDFALIPRYDAIGAAIANDAAQVLVALPAILYVRRLLAPADWRPVFLLKTLFAAAAGGLAAWLGVILVDGVAGLLAGLALGLAVFAAAVVATRLLAEDDGAWLEEALEGMLGSGVRKAVRLCVRPARPQAT
jgi:O-antigen/teichoic acid export membrane protein